MGVKSVGSALRSLTSITSVAISSTNCFNATYDGVYWLVGCIERYAVHGTYFVVGKHAVQRLL
jgi:hypothetical protein